MFKKLKYWKTHHGIEMFGVLLSLCIVLMAISSVSIISYANAVDRDYLEGNPFYNANFVTSKSLTKGEIKAFYTNADNTKCAIMLYFNPITNMSTNANDYQIFYKGYNVSKGGYTKRNLNKPVGGYYIFGSTGYAMIYLVASEGFQQQAAEVVVRCLESIYTSEYSSESVRNLQELDESYKEYDQYRLIINPAGQQATVVDFLDDFDVERVYQQCIVDEQESKIRETLIDDVVRLNELWARIASFKTNLVEAGVNTVDLPDVIKGDQFVNCPDADDHKCDISSKPLKEDVTTQLVYIPNTILEGGVDFDWFHEDLHTADFLNPMLGGKTEIAFFETLRRDSELYRSDRIDQNDFSMLDGTPINFDRLSRSSLVTDQQVYTAIREYIDAVNSYISLKNQYQTRDLVSYLELQYNMQSTGKTFSSNLEDDAVHVW